MNNCIVRMVGVLAAASGSAAMAAPAATPVAPPPVITPAAPQTPRSLPPATPVRVALARELVGYTQPPELMTSAVMAGWEKGLAEEQESFDTLDAAQPGFGTQLAERGKAEIVGLVRERIPQLHDRLATHFAASCTEQELKDLIAFYSSPTGAKLIRSITMSDTDTDAFDDNQLTATEATRMNRKASLGAIKELNADDQAAVIKFAFSPAGRAAKMAGPTVQAISAEWLNSVMAEFGNRVERIAQELLEKGAKEAK
jgi:hypothetical protein